MTTAMPRPRPLHLIRQITRHGKTVWYFRRGKGRRIRLKAAYGTEEFWREYQAALQGEGVPPPTLRACGGTLAWALGLYRESSAWLKLSKATRRQRDNIFLKVLKAGGEKPLTAYSKKVISDSYEKRAATPAAARNFLEAMRGLMRWAKQRDLIKVDPTAELKAVRPKSDGFPTWTEEEIAKFQAHYKLGTRERVAFDILLYSGLRRGDAVMFGRQHVKDGVGRMTTEKTDERVFIPIEPELAATLEAGPCGDLTFISGANRKPMVKESFGTWFRVVCREIKIEKSAHGLRKAGATRDAERGWTEAELNAKYGWRGFQMAGKYTRAVNRERVAVAAAERSRKNAS